MSEAKPMLSYAVPQKRTTRRFVFLPCLLAFVVCSTIPPYVFAQAPKLASLYSAFGLRLSNSGQILYDYMIWYLYYYGWMWIAAGAVVVGFAAAVIAPRPLPRSPNRTTILLLSALVLILFQLHIAQSILATDAINALQKVAGR